MLRAASVELASRSRVMTSVARTQRSLGTVDSLLPGSSATHHMLRLDWTQPDRFLHSLQQHIAAKPPDLIVAWIHENELAIRFAESLAAAERTCRFFHVIGSAAADPSAAATSYRTRLQQSSVDYHQVILGYVVVNDAPRWLTNEEISAGVLKALACAEPVYVVGTVQPWSSRP